METRQIIDIHAHMIPGVDDGARDMEESMAMLRMAEKEHIRKIILTPHQRIGGNQISVAKIEEKISEMERAMKLLHINIELYPGSELFYSYEIKNMIEEGKVCTLAGSHYVLVEFMPAERWSYIRTGLYRLVSAGYRPVIAHAERYRYVMESMDRIQELIEIGCYIQVNAGSIAGEYGWKMKRFARKLIKHKFVHFLGTDAHSQNGKRALGMRKCTDWLYKKDREYAEKLLWKNAENIFSDTDLCE